MADLRGMTVLVTGGGGGIGRAACARLARDGANVAVLDIDEDAARATLDGLDLEGGRAIARRCDVSSEDSLVAAVAHTIAELGPLTGVFANAGVSSAGPLHELTLDEWNRVIGVDLTGVFLTIKHCLPSMLEHGGGSIVTVGSISSVVAVKGGGSAGYKAAKGGVNMLTKMVAVDYAEAGIRANCLCPGAVDTNIWSSVSAAGAEPVPRPVLNVPLGRRAQPAEIASVLSFLLSSEASYITGATMMVDGGYTAV